MVWLRAFDDVHPADAIDEVDQPAIVRAAIVGLHPRRSRWRRRDGDFRSAHRLVGLMQTGVRRAHAGPPRAGRSGCDRPWTDGRISFIRDYRYVRYVVDDAELALAPDAKPAGDGAAH
jgi:RNA polymerase sigma-70 factor (ECF subfamily)